VDPLGRNVSLEIEPNGLPASLHWETSDDSPNAVHLEFEPIEAERGHGFQIVIQSINADGATELTFDLYVPSPHEEAVVITEFLPNPSGDPLAPLFNPLHRATPSPADQIHREDEFVELVNFGVDAVDLAGWTLSDAVAVRHVFGADHVLAPGATLVVFGGVGEGSAPAVDGGSEGASEGTAGLALNNAGDRIVLRNAAGNLISRVEYSGDSVSGDSSLTRDPEAGGPFVPHSSVSGLAASPGARNDGSPFPAETTPPDTELPPPFVLSIDGGGPGGLVLRWTAAKGQPYSVWRAADLSGPFVSIADALAFPTGDGEFTDPDGMNGSMSFYQVRSP
jgi:hypothetical protein